MISPKIVKYLSWLIFYLVLALILTINCLNYLDPDFGWHLRVGETIAQTKNIPYDQSYMWSLEGKTWVDHEWLSNLITYGLWVLGDYIAVSLFFILLPLASLLILNRYLFTHYLKLASHRLAFASLELVALIACLPHFGVRLQEFSFLLTILLFIIIDSCRRTQTIKNAYWLAPLLFLWACLHGSFLFGVAIVLGWISYEIILKIFPIIKNYFYEESLNNKNLKKLLLIVLVAILLTLATPYGTKLYSFLGDYATNRYYLSNIEEWRTPYSLPFVYWQIIYTQIILVLVLATRNYFHKNTQLWKLVIALLLLILASRSVRHFPLWVIGSLLFLAPRFIQLNLENINLVSKKIIKGLIILCLLLTAITLSLKINFIKNPFTNYCDNFPCGAVQFLKTNPHYGDLKIFNDYGWGGFLIGVWPEKKLFIDGRLPQYNFKNHTLLEEYSEFFQTEKIKTKLDEYEIKLVLIRAKEPAFEPDWLEQLITGEKPRERKNPINEYLKTDPDWALVYSDEVALIYARK